MEAFYNIALCVIIVLMIIGTLILIAMCILMLVDAIKDCIRNK